VTSGKYFAIWRFLLRISRFLLRSLEQCERVFEKHKPTHVLHLAAFVGGLFRNMTYPVDFWNSNVDMNNNIMKCAHKYGVTKQKALSIYLLSILLFSGKKISVMFIHLYISRQDNIPY
jgi:UDP-glucose 4-epimerase